MRDTIKNENYFQALIEGTEQRIKRFKNKLDEGIKEDRITPVRMKIFSLMFDILVGKFSFGISINTLQKDFDKTIHELEGEFLFGYNRALYILSLAILLEISNEDFNKIVTAIDTRAYNNEDALLDYLIAYRIPNRTINNKLQFPKPYASLLTAIESNSKFQAQIILKTYLEKKWYPGHSDCGWHDSHKSPNDTYFGYWSFETAAIVKIMELDDSSFKDNQYYSYDLLHWKA